MIDLDAELHGVGPLMDQFERFDKKMVASSLKKVARRGGNVFLKEVRKEAPRETGQLAKSIKLSVRVLGRIGQASAITKVKSNKDAATGRNPAHYQHLVVRGTDPHVIQGRPSLFFASQSVSQVNHPGATANPYVDRAVDRKTREATRTVARELRVELDRLIAIDRARREIRDLLR